MVSSGDARDTLPARFFANARRLADRVLHTYPVQGARFPAGWATAAGLVRDLASGLVGLGHQPSEPVAILATAGREVIYCDLAVLAIGGITVVIPGQLGPGAWCELVAHSEARICIVADAEQVDVLAPWFHRMPALRHIVVMDPGAPEAGRSLVGDRAGLAVGERIGSSPAIHGYDDLLRAGRGDPVDVAGRAAELGPLDAAMFLYTSGTTGRPRAVMLTHGNLSAALAGLATLGWGPDDIVMSLAPLSCGAGRIMGLLGAWVGAQRAHVGEENPLASSAPRIRPTVIIARPIELEALIRDLHHQFSRSPAGQRLFAWASELARQRRPGRGEGAGRGDGGPAGPARLALARRMVLNRLSGRLGGRVRVIVVLGGPCAAGVCEFFEAAGARVLTGWGMAETGFAGMSRLPGGWSGAGEGSEGRVQDECGGVGPALPGVDIELADDGEILIRGGSVFSGYYKAEMDTAAAFTRDGFLRTGDVAERMSSGGYRVLGRRRDVIVTLEGRRIMPQVIEAWMRGDPRIFQVVVFGHGERHLGGLFTVWEGLRRRSSEEDIERLVDGIVAARNVELERVEQVKRFRLLPHPLSVATGELSASGAIRRDVVAAKFGYLIDELFE